MTNVAKKKQLPAFLVLTIIAVIAALVLAATNEVTKGPIAAHAAAERNKAFAAVLPAASYEEQEIPAGHAAVTGLYAAVDDSGAPAGYTVVAAASGYAGPVAVTLGIDPDGMVTGAVIGDTSFAETAGFGMRWKEETDRWEQFKLIDTANGGSIEAISGATVTSGAVLNATNAAINCVNEVRGVAARDVVSKGTPAAKPIETMELTGGIHEGSARGFASDVRVQLTMDDANVVTGLVIDSTGETAGFGSRAMEEPEFAKQFVGQSAPFELGKNIDALTGATVTSTAVVAAVNAACEAPVNPDAVPFDLGGGEEEPAVEASTTPVAEGAKTASSPGFMGNDVGVTVTFNEDGTIATLDFDLSKQMAPNCELVNTDDYKANFIGKKGPFTVDAVATATFTSNGIVEALNSLFPAEEALVANEMIASAPGFMGNDVTVKMTLNEDGTIATLDFDLSEQMAPNCELVNTDDYKANFIGKKGPFAVDAVATATFTSNGIVEALNSLFPAEEAPAADALTASAAGFMNNPVGVTVTLNEDGTIATLDFDLSKQMAPNCELVNTDDYKANFIGKKGPFTVDAVATATFTSNGIVEALNSLFPAEEAAEEAPVANEMIASAPGFMGNDVGVTVTFNEDGTIATLDFDLSKQMAPNCELVNTEDYKANFIGKKGPFTVDAVATATFTSNGIVEALNSLFPAEEAAATDVLTASAAGFMNNPVGVTVTLNEDGTIATLDFDLSEQMAPNCELVNTDDYKANFIGKKGPFTVDAVATATFTSNGIVEALNSMFPAEEAAATEALTASAAGFMNNPVGVTVTLNEDGTIATLDFDLSEQMAPNCELVNTDDYKANFIGKKGPFTVDAVATATFTSNGIVEALNSLFPAEEAAEEAPVANEMIASAPGFMGNDVTVKMTLNEDGTIATLDFDLSEQMAPNCELVNTDDYKANFIGKKGPFTVDAVATATFTSNGIVEALNSMFPTQDMSVTGE